MAAPLPPSEHDVARFLSAGATTSRKPRGRSTSPSRTETLDLLRRVESVMSRVEARLMEVDDAAPTSSRAMEVDDAASPRRSDAMAVEDDAAGQQGVVVEMYRRNRERGVVEPVARSAPVAELTTAFLTTLARYSLTQLNASNFFTLWRVMRRESCTTRLGSGVYGSVFRVCKDDGCTSCVAVKFGMALTPSGTVPDSTDAKASSRAKDAEIKATTRMHGLTWDEVTNTRVVTQRVAHARRSPHVMEYLHHVAAPHALFMFVEYVPPLHPHVGSLFHLTEGRGVPYLTRLSDRDWRCLVFQALYTLAALQATFRGFRHNDTKLDNWGVRAWDGADHTYRVGDVVWRLPAQHIMVKLLDFGIAHSEDAALASADIAAAYDTAAAGSEFVDYGTVPTPCPLYDAHLMLNLMLNALHKLGDAVPWLPTFQAFVYACIPRRFFAAPRVSQYQRLTVAAQAELVRASGSFAPRDMLQHAYFEGLRAPPDTTAEYAFV